MTASCRCAIVSLCQVDLEEVADAYQSERCGHLTAIRPLCDHLEGFRSREEHLVAVGIDVYECVPVGWASQNFARLRAKTRPFLFRFLEALQLRLAVLR